jgi:alpha-beta hydrolase superfamily lysophospholipase
VSAALARCAELSRRLALATLLILSFSAMTGCATRLPSAPAAAPIVLPLPEVAADVWDRRGHVLHQEPFEVPPDTGRDLILGRAWRAVYTSVSGVDGGAREVSGAFFLPRGAPPENGWPVISLAHGTTGIGHGCGPSRRQDLWGYAAMIESLLADKYAVAVPDYEGLGESGSHPYLEPRTAAFNTIDAVRAMRDLVPTVSSRWMAVGYSQGGQAVWAANELNSYNGNDLQLQGSVALAPATNLTGAADLAWSGSMTEDQRARYSMLIVGLARYNADLNEASFLHGSTEAYRKQLSRCQSRRTHVEDTPTAPVLWQGVVDRLSESNALRPDTPQDVAKLQNVLRRVALPQRPLEKPMLVITGTRDTVVLADWIRTAVSESCALGGRIEYVQIADAGHLDLVPKAAPMVRRWIAERFAGSPAPSNCPAGQQ